MCRSLCEGRRPEGAPPGNSKNAAAISTGSIRNTAARSIFADIIEPGRVYEVGYPGASARRSTPGSWTLQPRANAPAKHLYVMEELLPGKDIRVEELETVLSERQRMPLPDHCRVAHCGAWLLQAASGARALGAGMVAAQNKKSRSQCFGIFNRVFSRLCARIDQHPEPGEEQQEHSQVEPVGDFGCSLEFFQISIPQSAETSVAPCPRP